MIDEAHNIFNNDHRSILLTRLIRKNKVENKNSRILYFSPLISDSENLKTNEDQKIIEKAIRVNIKDPQIFELNKSGEKSAYNRYLDNYFETNKKYNYIEYIINHSKKNNFIYIKKPKSVERFAIELSSSLEITACKELEAISKVIASNVHEDFYGVELVKKGVIYLHGKLPDIVKEYLEHKFRASDNIKYIIANSVILEGVNLPIDNLYILNTYGMNAKDLQNLIGRVNRLNEVFDEKNDSLSKLLPTVHFVSSLYAGKNQSMRSKISLLRSRVLKDDISNPTLLNFDDSNSDAEPSGLTEAGSDNINSRYKNIIKNEEFIIFESHKEENKLKSEFLQLGIEKYYFNVDLAIITIEKKYGKLANTDDFHSLHIIDKIYKTFIEESENNIKDKLFLRLRNQAARDFYKLFTKNTHQLNLKEHINYNISYFHSIKNKPTGRFFYVGTSYGEIAKPATPKFKAYIDLNKKSSKELANLALIKIKMENDFVSYNLNQLAILLKEVELITEDEFNIFIYGTAKKKITI